MPEQDLRESPAGRLEAELPKNLICVLPERRCGTLDACRRPVEARCWAGLSDPAGDRVIAFLEQLVGENLGMSDHF